MSASNSLTRGPLPPGVYWRRRIVVLVGAAVLVFAIAHLLGGGGDGSSGGDPAAQQAAAPISTSTGTTTAPTAPTVGPTSPTVSGSGPSSKGTGATAATSPLVLAAPEGKCNPADIKVTPRADHAVAATDVTITFALQTVKTPACTFQVTPRDLAVKIVRHGRVLWTSQQCRDALPERTVVVRNVVPSLVSMVWDGEFSTVGCRRSVGWVRPGPLTIYAATLGGEPGHGDATLQAPGAATTSASPSATSSATSASPRAKVTPTASGTPEPRR